MQQLYTKVMQGKRTTYVPYVEDDAQVINLTDKQCVTAAGALGATLINILSRNVKTPIIKSRITAVEKEILRMFQDTGAPLDMDIANLFCSAWDRAIREMSAEVPNAQS